MPVPVTAYKKQPRWKWETLLNPVRAAPGSPAKIRTHKKRGDAEAEIRAIKNRMREARPYEKWTFQARSMQDLSGEFGVFAIYQGIMSEQEYQEKKIKSALWSERVKLAKEKKKLERELGGITDIRQITRATGRRQ
jgi:hypothetical protein